MTKHTPASSAVYRRSHYKSAAALLAALAAAGSSHAVQRTWVGNTDANLLTASNYADNTAPVSNSDGILFNAAGSAGANLTLNSPPTSFQFSNAGGALTFSSTASAYTIGGTSEIILGSGAIVNNSSQTQTFNSALRRNTGNNFTIGANNGGLVFNNTFSFGASGGTLNTAFGTTTGGFIRFGGNIIVGSATGTLNLVASGTGGAGTVEVNGSNNTGLNAITINAGNTLRVGSTTGLASLSTLTFNNNSGTAAATVVNASSGAISTNASLGITNTGNLTFGATGNTSANNIAFNGTTAIAADLNRTVTINGTGVTISTASVWNNTSVNSRTLTVTGAGNTFQVAGIGIGATGETSNRNFTVAGDGNLRVTGGVGVGSGSGTRALTLTGSGTVTIEGASDYNGTTTVGPNATLIVNGAHTGGNTYTVNGTFGGDGSTSSSVIFNAGSKFLFNTNTVFDVNGASVTFGGFSIADLVGLTNSVNTGVYTLIGGSASISSTNLANFGSGSAADLGLGKSAYFQFGDLGADLNTLQVVVIPEPSAFAALAGLAGLGFAASRRRRA